MKKPKEIKNKSARDKFKGIGEFERIDEFERIIEKELERILKKNN